MTTNLHACPDCGLDMRVLGPVMFHTPVARYTDPDMVVCSHDGATWPCRRRVDIHRDTHRYHMADHRRASHGSDGR